MITYADQVRATGMTPLACLARFACERLAGHISGIHILPFYPWSSDDGFSVKDYQAVDPEYGTWGDVESLARRFDLMVDAVFNHMSAQSDWFQRYLAGDPDFAEFFVSVNGTPDLSQVVRPRALPLLTEFRGVEGPLKVWTTFSADQVDLNVKNPRVLLAFVDALLFYVAKGARFIRLDAIAFLWKEMGTSCLHLPQTHRVIQLMRSVLDVAAPGTRLITETNVPHRDNISYFGNGFNEAQLVYNFALPPLVLHSLATGNAAKLSTWAESLRVPSCETAFFNFLASHDGIGLNPARGILSEAEIEALVRRTLEHGGLISWKNLPDGKQAPYEMNINYFDALSNPGGGEPIDKQIARFLCAHAIMLALPGVAGIYFHSLLGSRGDRGAAESSGIARRINRQKLELELLEREMSSVGTLRHQVFNGLKALLELRRAYVAFDPESEWRVLNLDPRVFALERIPSGGEPAVLCLHNVSDQKVQLGREQKLNGIQSLDPYEVRWVPGD
jgi:glucosylglycerate phosphorylase